MVAGCGPFRRRFRRAGTRLTVNRSKLLACLVVLLAAGAGGAATYHVDAVGGNDAGDGSQAAPFRTLACVRPLLAGGDTVLLHDGDYGPIEESPDTLRRAFDDWVTYQAAPGAAPQVEHIRLGAEDTPAGWPQNPAGSWDARLRFEGLHVKDGVQSVGARHWALVNCLVERRGPWTGSAENIDKTAIECRGGEDILVEGCEVTNTGTAIAAGGRDVRLVANHLHDGTHTGLRAVGLRDSLVEGNLIHGFDDGVSDSEAAWSRHATGLEILPACDAPEAGNRNIIFRSNIVYDCEANVVRIGDCGSARNEMLVFENNVFGPGQALMFDGSGACDALIIRHNTVVCAPGGRRFNRWLCSDYTLYVGGDATDVEIYNNILGAVTADASADLRFFDWNLIQTAGSSAGDARLPVCGPNTIICDAAGFLDPEGMDYRLLADSLAVDAGTRLWAPDPLYEYDYEGAPRDGRPDLGAWELPGQEPSPEAPTAARADERPPEPLALDGRPPEIIRWEVLENHGLAGEIARPASDGFVASTIDGLRKVRVTFTRPVDPATVGPSAVSLRGQLSGDVSYLVSAVRLSDGGATLTIHLDAGLPDEDRYVLTLRNTVTGAGAAPLAGNRDLVFVVLAGDVNASGAVAPGDVLAMRSKIGQPVTPETAPYDVDCSGDITAIDMLTVRALEGHGVP